MNSQNSSQTQLRELLPDQDWDTRTCTVWRRKPGLREGAGTLQGHTEQACGGSWWQPGWAGQEAATRGVTWPYWWVSCSLASSGLCCSIKPGGAEAVAWACWQRTWVRSGMRGTGWARWLALPDPCPCPSWNQRLPPTPAPITLTWLLPRTGCLLPARAALSRYSNGDHGLLTSQQRETGNETHTGTECVASGPVKGPWQVEKSRGCAVLAGQGRAHPAGYEPAGAKARAGGSGAETARRRRATRRRRRGHGSWRGNRTRNTERLVSARLGVQAGFLV